MPVAGGSNFVVAITFPPLVGTLTSTGAFAWYAGWNCVGFVLAFFLVPETKGRSLEDLDNGELQVPSRALSAHSSRSVFSMSGHEYARSRFSSREKFGHGLANMLRHRSDSGRRWLPGVEDSRA